MRIFQREMLHKSGIKWALRCKQAHKVRIKDESAVFLYCLQFSSLISPSACVSGGFTGSAFSPV